MNLRNLFFKCMGLKKVIVEEYAFFIPSNVEDALMKKLEKIRLWNTMPECSISYGYRKLNGGKTRIIELILLKNEEPHLYLSLATNRFSVLNKISVFAGPCIERISSYFYKEFRSNHVSKNIKDPDFLLPLDKVLQFRLYAITK